MRWRKVKSYLKFLRLIYSVALLLLSPLNSLIYILSYTLEPRRYLKILILSFYLRYPRVIIVTALYYPKYY